jgi:hypothetical protein
MEHILTECREHAVEKIWQMARKTWPHKNLPWPNISMGLILGCRCITTTREELQRENENRNRTPNRCGAMRLLTILITESAYLIWVPRCERVIREKCTQIPKLEDDGYKK